MHKIIRFGNLNGMILPKSCLQRLGEYSGDLLALTEAPGGHRLTRYDPIEGIQRIHAADTRPAGFPAGLSFTLR